MTRRAATVTQGMDRTEYLFHREFAKEYIRGEWFRASKRLLAFIADHRSGGSGG